MAGILIMEKQYFIEKRKKKRIFRNTVKYLHVIEDLGRG